MGPSDFDSTANAVERKPSVDTRETKILYHHGDL